MVAAQIRRLLFLFASCTALLSIAGCSFLSRKAPAAPEPPAPQTAAPGSEAASETDPEEPRKKLRWQDIVFFWWPKRKPGPPVAAPLQTAGIVSFVNLPAGFVILETAAGNSIEEGQVLSALKDGRVTSRVKVTPDRRPPFIVAEILDGTPERGDRFHPVVLD